MSAARLAELLRRFKHFGCKEKEVSWQKAWHLYGIYGSKHVWHWKKHFKHRKAAAVSLPLFWGCHLLLRRPKETLWLNTRRDDFQRRFPGGTSAKLLQASQTAASRHCRRGEAVVSPGHPAFSLNFRHQKQTSSAYGRRVWLFNSIRTNST